MWDLHGKKVLITGAARRVGACFVRRFADAGASVLIHCNHSVADAEKLLSELPGSGHDVVRYDLSDPSSVPGFIERLPRNLSVLVNNASTFVREPFLTETESAAEVQFNVNFRSPLAMIKAFYRHSEEEELAAVNLLDQAVVSSDSASFSYLLSKKALAESVGMLARQLAPRMRVNGLAPGPVFPPVGLEHLRMEKTRATLPLKRTVDPSDLAESCYFLAVNRSITGTVLFTDCGQSLL